MTTYNDASLREFGDDIHMVAYVEVNHLVYSRIKHFKRIVNQVDYFNLKDKGKLIGSDFCFDYHRHGDKGRIRVRLEALLGVKLEPFR